MEKLPIALGELYINYKGTDVIHKCTLISVKCMANKQPVANFVVRGSRAPHMTLKRFRELGAVRTYIQNGRDIHFALTEDQLPNYGLGKFTLRCSQQCGCIE